MAPVQIPNYNKWNRPPTSVYDNNYGYGINFYQPMIDYINAKEQGHGGKPPHLPWNNERGLEKYRFDKPIRAYSEEDVSRISHEISEQAKRDLNDFRVAKRSAFSVIATAAAANVTKHVGGESVTEKAKKKRIERDTIKSERQKKRMEEIEREIETLENEAKVGADLRSKAIMYRGKSAKAIAQVLLTESRRNVDEARVRNSRSNVRKSAYDKYTRQAESWKAMESRQTNIQSRSMAETMTEITRTVRETSPRRSPPRTCIVRIHQEIPIIDDSYLQRISELKQTLKELDNINTYFVLNQRYSYKPRLYTSSYSYGPQYYRYNYVNNY